MGQSGHSSSLASQMEFARPLSELVFFSRAALSQRDILQLIFYSKEGRTLIVVFCENSVSLTCLLFVDFT